jgi:putative flippase GtrA
MHNRAAQALRLLASRQFIRFLVVGVVNTLFSYLVYAGLLFLGVNFAVANLGAVALGVLFGFKTQGTWVFRNSSNRLLRKYAAFWIVIYMLNIGLIKALMTFGLNAYWAGALALAPVALASYLVQKYIVFSRRVNVDSDLR